MWAHRVHGDALTTRWVTGCSCNCKKSDCHVLHGGDSAVGVSTLVDTRLGKSKSGSSVPVQCPALYSAVLACVLLRYLAPFIACR